MGGCAFVRVCSCVCEGVFMCECLRVILAWSCQAVIHNPERTHVPVIMACLWMRLPSEAPFIQQLLVKCLEQPTFSCFDQPPITSYLEGGLHYPSLALIRTLNHKSQVEFQRRGHPHVHGRALNSILFPI